MVFNKDKDKDNGKKLVECNFLTKNLWKDFWIEGN